ncbi:MAG: GAF domain-containing sensor histidine kinase, partial [Thermoanaerobaculia bacterium]
AEAYSGPASGLPAAVRRRLPERGSVAVVPAEIDGTLRGTLVFIAEDAERTWSPSELEALQAAARMLGTALRRRQVQAMVARVERSKREFLTTVSHELRTPLTSVLGAVDLLKAGGLEARPARARELLAVAERNGERLQRLITDLLDLERLEAGELRFQPAPVPVGALVEEAVHGIAGFAALHGVRVRAATAAEASSLVTDRNRLAQVLYNLLSNAIKFSAAGDEVVLSARCLDGEVEFVVRDRGPGIAEEVKDRLFERFVQAQGAPGGHGGGSGLGLSISKRLVEGLGGSIALESAPETGTAVTVRLPQSLGGTAPLV